MILKQVKLNSVWTGTIIKMAKTAELNKKVFPYILDAIDTDDYIFKGESDKERLGFLYDIFVSEYGHMISRVGTQKAFSEWIQGLPSCFNIDFNNYDILKLAKKWGSLPANPTEKQEDKILANWWNFITSKTFQLFRKHKIRSSK